VGLYTVTIEETTIGEKLTTLVVSDESWAAVTTKDNLVPYVAAIFVVTDEDAVQKDASVLENPIRENSCELSKEPNDDPTTVNDEDPLAGTTCAMTVVASGDVYDTSSVAEPDCM
jgi:hypothetical protein